MNIIKCVFYIFCFSFIVNSISAQSLIIPTSETGQKIVALVDLQEHGQLLVTQQDNTSSLNLVLIDNELNIKWEAIYDYEDGNGKKAANFFTFLHDDIKLYITNQNIKNYYGQIDIESGDILYEQLIIGTSELRRGEFYVSNNQLLQANIEGAILRLQKITNNRLESISEIKAPSSNSKIKNTSIQIIKISHDTVFAFQTLPEPNHRNLNIIFYRFNTNGRFIDSSINKLKLPKYAFSFNSAMDLNCSYVFEHKNKISMFGNLAPRLADNYGQFPASDDSRGFWWASFDSKMHTEHFSVYPFSALFQKDEEIIYWQAKYWGVKADGDSGFFLNMNLIPGGTYTGNLTSYINMRGELKMFTTTEDRDNFMRYNPIFTREYIKKSDVLVTNDDWNFFANHQFSKLNYYPAFHSKFTKAITERAKKHDGEAQKSDVSYTILYKNGFAIIAEYYYKKKKLVKLEIVRD